MRGMRSGSAGSLESFAILCRDEFPALGKAAEFAEVRLTRCGILTSVRCRKCEGFVQILHGWANCFLLATAIGLMRTVHSEAVAMTGFGVGPREMMACFD